MIEYWERRHHESWVERWLRLTDNAPKGPIKATKALNSGAVGYNSTIANDARTLSSRKFKNQ